MSDPALIRYLEAIDAFEAYISVTPALLERYVEDALGDADEVAASSFPVTNVEQFLLFERLHEAGLGALAQRYEFEVAHGIVDNGWVERRAFVLRRREVANG